jgi:phosphoglycolate phosphatase-like HAD superfamily hydrolase
MGWLPFFPREYIGTASDVERASRLSPGESLDKPHSFTYACAVYGNDPENYSAYAREEQKLTEDDEVWVVGDSLSDIWGAHRIGARAVGVLTGLEGERARTALEDNGAEKIIARITDLPSVLPG